VDKAKSIQVWITNTRHNLIDKDIFKQEGTVYKFTSNYMFTAPSGAAGVVLGRTANGWVEWKYQAGNILDEVKRQNGEP